jgi:ATP-dependent RNA helicase DeaD
MRRLRSSEIDVLISGLTTANVLVSRSALDLQTVSCLLVAWPESWPDEDALAPLMQDLPKESQRIIYTSDPSRVVELAERYARKALTVGAAPAAVGPVGPVRTVSTPWSQRLRAVGDLVELLDPTSLAVWTIDRSYHDAIAQIVNSGQCEVAVVAREPAAAATIVAFDLPTNEKLRELVSAGEVVLLVPPGAEAYVASIAAPRRPIQLPAVIDTALEAEAAQRSAIVQTIESGQVNRSVATLAPLFERYDPVTVAGALLELWSKAGTSPTPASPEAAITAKVYVGAGKKDGVTPHDLVAVLTKDLRVQREKIGRIELRDTFSLIEIPSIEAEHVARGLNGSTIRKRRVTARVDRGPTNVNKRRV